MGNHVAKCGKTYTVKINGQKFTKYCGKKRGHWGRCG